jgi:hypothetical protein
MGLHVKPMALVWLGLAAIMAGQAAATEPATRPEQTGTGIDIQQQSQGAPLGFAEQMISGTVTDSFGKPLGGVAIKLFAAGSLVHVGYTTGSGAYEMPLPLNVDKDETVVLWLISTDRPLMPQHVVLKQSSYARKYDLFGPCVLEAKMRPQMRVDVKLLDENEELAALKARGCL